MLLENDQLYERFKGERMVHLLKLMKTMEEMEMGEKNHLSRTCLQKGGVSQSIVPISYLCTEICAREGKEFEVRGHMFHTENPDNS